MRANFPGEAGAEVRPGAEDSAPPRSSKALEEEGSATRDPDPGRHQQDEVEAEAEAEEHDQQHEEEADGLRGVLQAGLRAEELLRQRHEDDIRAAHKSFFIRDLLGDVLAARTAVAVSAAVSAPSDSDSDATLDVEDGGEAPRCAGVGAGARFLGLHLPLPLGLSLRGVLPGLGAGLTSALLASPASTASPASPHSGA
ncbi:Eukaryotic translation initiation factor 3 subunit B [Frankliniella fusca]|uniref:Eukaryotic translation initiation factor 3 subunit B n=1 Tax=Frankliniella fusca TaxID=407009 RepID=A0AAE1H284_9NEOP|nr:Eukaryotic translation initiation factor 3 subunit B [Frankliniella fusca]